MTIKAEHKELIALAVKRSPHYKGNEDLFDAFCDEIYSRIHATLQVLGNAVPSVTYLDKVTQKSLLHVLKDRQRLSTKVYDSELPIKNLVSFNINEKGEIVFDIPYPNSEREKFSVIHEQLRVIINNLYKLNENEPEKQYLKLFELKYNQNLKISDIAFQMEISEAQTTQKLFELLAKLNDY